MAGREFDALTNSTGTEPSEADIAAVLDRKVMALPTFVSGVGPYPHATGRWTVDPQSAGERTAAASLYLALVTATCLELAGTGRFIAVEGPLARNTLYCRALAALAASEVIPSAETPPVRRRAPPCCSAATRESRRDEPVAPLAGEAFRAYAAAWRARQLGAFTACGRRLPAARPPARCPAWSP